MKLKWTRNPESVADRRRAAGYNGKWYGRLRLQKQRKFYTRDKAKTTPGAFHRKAAGFPIFRLPRVKAEQSMHQKQVMYRMSPLQKDEQAGRGKENEQNKSDT